MFSYPIDADLELRLLLPYHAEQVFALVDRNRDYLRRWLVWVDATVGVEDTHKFIREGLEKLALGIDLHAGIWYRGQLAGITSLFDINRRSGSAEIGYWLSADCQGKGMMTRSCKVLLDHGFGTLGLNRIQIKAEPANTRSAAIPKRLGFQHEGTLRQGGLGIDGPADIDVFSLLREEWEAQK